MLRFPHFVEISLLPEFSTHNQLSFQKFDDWQTSSEFLKLTHLGKHSSVESKHRSVRRLCSISLNLPLIESQHFWFLEVEEEDEGLTLLSNLLVAVDLGVILPKVAFISILNGITKDFWCLRWESIFD
jgi:hypothetical protein